jgi:hypothetical protein
MREYSQIQGFIAVLMIFILLTCLSGCSTTKIISKADLPLPDSSKYCKYPYVVHVKRSMFLLDKWTISDDTLTGTINQMDKIYSAKKKIHLYLSADSTIKIDKGEFISVPLEKVTKVEFKKPSATKTAILVTTLIAVAVGGTVLLANGMTALYSAFDE